MSLQKSYATQAPQPTQAPLGSALHQALQERNEKLQDSLVSICSWFELLTEMVGWTKDNGHTAFEGHKSAKALLAEQADARNSSSEPSPLIEQNERLESALRSMCAWFELLADMAGWTPDNGHVAFVGYHKARVLLAQSLVNQSPKSLLDSPALKGWDIQVDGTSARISMPGNAGGIVLEEGSVESISSHVLLELARALAKGSEPDKKAHQGIWPCMERMALSTPNKPGPSTTAVDDQLTVHPDDR